MILELSLVSLGPVLVIPFIVMIMVYMFAYATQNNSLLMLIRGEVTEYILFLILFGVLSSFIFSDFSNNLLGFTANYIHQQITGSPGGPYTAPSNSGEAHDKLMDTAYSTLNNNRNGIISILHENAEYLRDISVLSSATQSVSFLSSTSFKDLKTEEVANFVKGVNPAADAMVSFSSCSGYNAALRSMSGFSTYLGIAIMAIKFQELLVRILASDGAVTAMLAIGILMRANPLTRSVGAFFLALGLGLYSIMPFAVIVSNDVVYSFFSQPPAGSGFLPLNTAITSFYSSYPVGISISYSLGSISIDCNPLAIQHYLEALKDMMKTPQAGTISNFLFSVILAQGITLLTFVSIIGGISKAFGAEISPFVIGRLTTYLSGG